MNKSDLARVFTLVPPPAIWEPNSDLHVIADEYERWLPLHELGQHIIEDQQATEDRILVRKAFAVASEAESRLKVLRRQLSERPSRNFSELARKVRILNFDASSWLVDPDPLFDSVCSDTMKLAGVEPIAQPPITSAMVEKLRVLDIEAPRQPWEDES